MPLKTLNLVGRLLFSHSVESDSLRPHGLQHIRPPCTLLSPGVRSNSCPVSQWCHPTIILCHSLLLLPSIFPISGSFPTSWLFVSGGQSIGASASATVLPVNIQGWFHLGLIGLICKGLSRLFSSTAIQKHQFFLAQSSLWFKSHIHMWPLEKPKLLTIRTFVSKVMSLLFNMLLRFVIALAWLIASLRYLSSFTMTRLWSM